MINKLKERIKELDNKLENTKLKSFTIMLQTERRILKEWIKREEEIMKIIYNKIENSYYNYKLTKPNDEELDELNVYYILIKKLKELKEEINK